MFFKKVSVVASFDNLEGGEKERKKEKKKERKNARGKKNITEMYFFNYLQHWCAFKGHTVSIVFKL